MIEVDTPAWSSAGIIWQQEGGAYRFLVPGRTEAPAVAIKRDKAGAPVTGPNGGEVLDLQESRSSSHRALASYLRGKLGDAE